MEAKMLGHNRLGILVITSTKETKAKNNNAYSFRHNKVKFGAWGVF